MKTINRLIAFAALAGATAPTYLCANTLEAEHTTCPLADVQVPTVTPAVAPPPSPHMPRALIRALATNCLLQNHASIWSPANDLLQLAGCESLPASMNAHPQSTGDLRKAKSAPRTTPLITHPRRRGNDSALIVVSAEPTQR